VLEAFAEEIWIAEGPTVSFYGFPYPTRSAIVRLPGARLWIWSPVRLTRELRASVERLGTPAHLVSPNKIHHLYLAEWKQHWPEARLWSPPGLRARRRDLVFDADLGDAAPAEWVDDIDQAIFRGSFAMEEVVFFHRRSRTAIVGDLIQRHDPKAVPTFRRWIMAADGLIGPHGSTPREWRWSFHDRRRTRETRGMVLGWNPERLLVAHGACALHSGQHVIREALRWMGTYE